MTARRDALDAGERETRSVRMCRLLEAEVFAPLRSRLNRPLGISLFAPFRSEVSPLFLMESCQGHGDLLYAPKILSSKEGMQLRRVEALSNWISGRWGVPEPDPDTTVPWEPLQPLDAVLVPGLAFSAAGGRLGYGGGYYDRFYAEVNRSSHAEPLWIGIGYALQLVGTELPIEPHDLRMDALATEERIIWLQEEGEADGKRE